VKTGLVSATVSIAGVKIETPDALAPKKSVRILAELANPQNLAFAGTLIATLRDDTGKTVATASAPAASDAGGRRDQDQRALVGLEVRVGELRAQVRRTDRGAEHRLPRVVGDSFDRMGITDRSERVVHHHVERAELVDCARDRGFDISA